MVPRDNRFLARNDLFAPEGIRRNPRSYFKGIHDEFGAHFPSCASWKRRFLLHDVISRSKAPARVRRRAHSRSPHGLDDVVLQRRFRSHPRGAESLGGACRRRSIRRRRRRRRLHEVGGRTREMQVSR